MRAGTGTLGVMAAFISAAAASTIAVVLAVTLLADHLISQRLAGAELSNDALHSTGIGSLQSPQLNREKKTDPLPFNRERTIRREIETIEVIGIRGAAIAYRDREGNVLFRTDPLANVTVVVKDVSLPEVTIRESAGTPVDRVEIDSSRPLPQGCETAFGHVAIPEQVQTSVRCFAAKSDSMHASAHPHD